MRPCRQNRNGKWNMIQLFFPYRNEQIYSIIQCHPKGATSFSLAWVILLNEYSMMPRLMYTMIRPHRVHCRSCNNVPDCKCSRIGTWSSIPWGNCLSETASEHVDKYVEWHGLEVQRGEIFPLNSVKDENGLWLDKAMLSFLKQCSCFSNGQVCYQYSRHLTTQQRIFTETGFVSNFGRTRAENEGSVSLPQFYTIPMNSYHSSHPLPLRKKKNTTRTLYKNTWFPWKQKGVACYIKP